MWHVDGNDKLKPYGFCISGAIDGWSRKILWLEVDITNNDPRLICTYFLNAVENLQIVPCIIRTDKGTENVNMADVQKLLRSTHNDDLVLASVMVGSSNHNQRIERFWGYCRNVLLQSYMDIFKDLELSGVLQMGHVLHMECLKFCFMKVLRKELVMHACNWNKHRVRNMRYAACPTGVPEFLYDHPHYFHSVDQGKPVDLDTVNLCQEIYFHQRNEFGSDNAFTEWALNVMLERVWSLPTTFQEALDLFFKLILVIYATDDHA